MGFGIYPETRFIPPKLRRGGLMTSTGQAAPVCQNTAVLRTLPQGIHHRIQFSLEFRRFQIRHVVEPAGIELFSGGAEVPTQIPDTFRLGIQLVTLTVGVFLFGLGQFSQFH